MPLERKVSKMKTLTLITLLLVLCASNVQAQVVILLEAENAENEVTAEAFALSWEPRLYRVDLDSAAYVAGSWIRGLPSSSWLFFCPTRHIQLRREYVLSDPTLYDTIDAGLVQLRYRFRYAFVANPDGVEIDLDITWLPSGTELHFNTGDGSSHTWLGIDPWEYMPSGTRSFLVEIAYDAEDGYSGFWLDNFEATLRMQLVPVAPTSFSTLKVRY